MTNKMAEAGADAALVITPCYYKNGMTSEALEKHFTQVLFINEVELSLSIPVSYSILMEIFFFFFFFGGGGGGGLGRDGTVVRSLESLVSHQ